MRNVSVRPYNSDSAPIIRLDSYRADTSMEDWRLRSYPVRFSGKKFISCYTVPFLSFQFYLSPFRPDLWAGIGVSLALLVSCLTVYVKYVFGDTSIFSPWLFILATLFEETISTPSSVERRNFYRLTFGLWALMATFLTNCYNGVMIENLVAPLPGVGVERFQDIACEQGKRIGDPADISAWMRVSGIDTYWEQLFSHGPMSNPLESPNCFRLLSEPSARSPWGAGNAFFLELKDLWLLIKFKSYRAGGKITPEILLLSPKHGRELEDGSERNLRKFSPELSNLISAEVAKCGKTVFIGNEDAVAQELLALAAKYNGKKFYTSKDSLRQDPIGLLFDNWDKSTLIRDIISQIESGIWRRLDQEMVSRAWRLRKKFSPVVESEVEIVVRIGGNFLTVFILCGILLTTAFVSLGGECRREIWAALSNFGALMWWRLRNYFLTH